MDPRNHSGGVPLSLAHTQELLLKSPKNDLITVCEQAAEIFPQEAFTKREWMSHVREKCGDAVLPVSINSLRDDSASRDWLEGRFSLPPQKMADYSNRARDRKATRALQRALMKIGVYHPDLDDDQRAAMLQMPWCANGILSRATMRALWVALDVSGRSYMQEKLSYDVPLDFTIAQAVEELLADKRTRVNPVSQVPYISLPKILPEEMPEGDTAPDTCLYIGLNRYGAAEAHQLQAVFEGSGIILDPLVDWEVVAGDIEYKGRFFSLRHELEMQTFLAEAFRPELTPEQRSGLEEVFTTWNIREDSLDEMAEIMVAFHEAEHGERNLRMIILSGHHSSLRGGMYADAGGMLPDQMLSHMAKLFPRAASQIEFVMIGASNRLFDYHVVQELEQLDQFQPGGPGVAFGYRGRAPGTWMGGLSHSLAAAKAFLASREAYGKKLREKDRLVTWSLFNKHLWILDLKGPDGHNYAAEFLGNLVIYNAQDGLYRLGGDGNKRPLQRAEGAESAEPLAKEAPSKADEASGRQVNSRVGRIRNEVDFNNVLQANFSGKDLRVVTPEDSDLLAYREQLADPEARRKVDLALHWNQISDQWLMENRELFDEAVRDLLWAHEELCLKGRSPFFQPKTTVDLRQDNFGEWLAWERKAQEVVRLAEDSNPPIPVDEETVEVLGDFRSTCLKLEVEDAWLRRAGILIHPGESKSSAEAGNVVLSSAKS